MLHLLHGDNIERSRKELTNIKQKASDKEIISLDGKTVTLTDVEQALQTNSLFGMERLVIIENLFTKRFTRKTADFVPFLQQIERIPQEVTVVFWEEKELSKTAINQFPKNTDIALFRPDKIIFQLVESILPGNSGNVLELLTLSLKKDSPELIFAMLIRQVRLLMMVKDLGKSAHELAPWQAARIAKQAQHFTWDQLLKLHEQLFTIDVKIKSGLSAFNLASEMKLFFCGNIIGGNYEYRY
ncbi:MAG: hypothetical protein AAB874_01975 [Patescibacteria group bacterium]